MNVNFFLIQGETNGNYKQQILIDFIHSHLILHIILLLYVLANLPVQWKLPCTSIMTLLYRGKEDTSHL